MKAFDKMMKVYNFVSKANKIALGGLQPVKDTLFVATTIVGLAEESKGKKEDEITVEYDIKDA